MKFNYLFLIAAVVLISAVFHGLGLFNVLPPQFVYSDLLGFFENAAAPGFPYLQKPVEYPVLIGLFMQAMAVIGKTEAGYYIASAIFLLLAAIIATYFLNRLTPEKYKTGLLKYWIFAPSMLAFSVYNWDILVIFLVILAFYFISKQKDNLAAIFLALGFSTKLYPVLYLPTLILKQKNVLERLKIFLVFILTAGAINLPFMFLNYGGWSYFLTLNAERNSSFDSIWTVGRYLFPALSVSQINILSLLLFAVLYFYIIFKRQDDCIIKTYFLITLAFLITNKVFSPQYLLWLLPFFALIPNISSRWFYALEFSNLILLFLALSWFFLGRDLTYFYWAIPFILLRYSSLSYFLIKA